MHNRHRPEERGRLMEFRLIVDKTAEENVTATVHAPNALTDELETLVRQYTGTDTLTGYAERERRLLHFGEITCIYVEGGKTYAAAADGGIYQLRLRLYEAEQRLPAAFIRFNKSAIGSLQQLERFTSSVTGAVDAVFRSGHREYVSRRCFADIRRRLEK